MSEGSGPCPVSKRDARHTHKGIYSGWLTKEKSDSAKVKWLSGSSRRLFTIDFQARLFYYSRGEGKASSEPVPFSEIVNAELLPQIGRRSFSRKVLYSDSEEVGFAVRTCDREMRLWSSTFVDATCWVEALNAARHLGRDRQCVGSSAPSKPSLSPAPSSMSTQEGSETSVQVSDSGLLSDADSGAPWIPPGEKTTEVSVSPDRGGYALPLTEAPSSTVCRAGYPSHMAEAVDPFAALEAFAEELSPGIDQPQVWTTERKQVLENRVVQDACDDKLPASASAGHNDFAANSVGKGTSEGILASETASCNQLQAEEPASQEATDLDPETVGVTVTPLKAEEVASPNAVNLDTEAVAASGSHVKAEEPASPKATDLDLEEKKKAKRKKKSSKEPQESAVPDAEATAEDLRRQQQDLALLHRYSATCCVVGKGQKVPEKANAA
eukprot:gnl/MRDRNA2_/MRDRNA2_36196_c0_seq1.p1 gnl/MRDRNA2_/MRDRNA2_36196_c0~~gnl/MRDRNA2_/MRDRNA2_36196_c0_seq1.p1  ORF type:complete len:440 (+),score=85.29 gnl/MRDRNA2_/MRDRNA2_36196_c0_seq1:66-1385(+)